MQRPRALQRLAAGALQPLRAWQRHARYAVSSRAPRSRSAHAMPATHREGGQLVEAGAFLAPSRGHPPKVDYRCAQVRLAEAIAEAVLDATLAARQRRAAVRQLRGVRCGVSNAARLAAWGGLSAQNKGCHASPRALFRGTTQRTARPEVTPRRGACHGAAGARAPRVSGPGKSEAMPSRRERMWLAAHAQGTRLARGSRGRRRRRRLALRLGDGSRAASGRAPRSPCALPGSGCAPSCCLTALGPLRSLQACRRRGGALAAASHGARTASVRWARGTHREHAAAQAEMPLRARQGCRPVRTALQRLPGAHRWCHLQARGCRGRCGRGGARRAGCSVRCRVGHEARRAVVAAAPGVLVGAPAPSASYGRAGWRRSHQEGVELRGLETADARQRGHGPTQGAADPGDASADARAGAATRVRRRRPSAARAGARGAPAGQHNRHAWAGEPRRSAPGGAGRARAAPGGARRPRVQHGLGRRA